MTVAVKALLADNSISEVGFSRSDHTTWLAKPSTSHEMPWPRWRWWTSRSKNEPWTPPSSHVWSPFSCRTQVTLKKDDVCVLFNPFNLKNYTQHFLFFLILHCFLIIVSSYHSSAALGNIKKEKFIQLFTRHRKYLLQSELILGRWEW